MSEPIYKILLFLKRRPGMTPDAFRDYYENHHAPLCAKYASGISRYMRRFVMPAPDCATGASEELPFDVITELWFEDEAIFRGTLEYLSKATLPDDVVEDEKQLFDRDKARMATVIECETI